MNILLYLPLLLLPCVLRAEDAPFAKWEKEIAALEAADKAHPPGADAVLFTGSSSIRLWDLKKSFPNLPAVNHGFGGSTIPDNIHFIPRLVLPLHPGKIVFYAGDNDSADGRSAAQIAADFQTYADTIHISLPAARIFYLPIKPSLARWKLRPLQQDANERVRSYCTGHAGWLCYIDTATPLLGPDGKPVAAYFKADGLHLNDQGYAVWAPLVERALASPVAARTLELVLVAGQSNAVGFNAKAADLPAAPEDKDIPFWWRCGDPPPDSYDSTSGGTWTTLQAQPRGTPNPDKTGGRQFGNFFEEGGGFGPEIGFGRTWHAAHQPEIAILKAAFSGTGLGSDWDAADPGPQGACYRSLVAETKAGIAAAAANHITLHPLAMIWVQGESDANAKDSPMYAARMKSMVAALRKDLASPQLIVLMALNTHFGDDKNPYVAKIVDAQKQVAAADPRCTYVDTSAEPIANAAHFNTQGTLGMGKRFADALLEMEKQDKGGR